MNWTVLKAIFKRDYVSYFSSPTGYVFICVFVVLSALATFWPPEFFASNLANLDQLSRWLPFIMLVFIPAITMSTWAEERRQGTDELLLTIPASDFDVVLGKYLAGITIFTTSLLFSAFSIFLVFKWGLGDPDVGLFISTYIGYWFIGLAMIAIGMVASFLTDNLTVGFILGMLFNLPLALFGVAQWFVKNPTLAAYFRRWSAVEQFRDFERGVLSLSGIAYFVLIAVVMLYISMVLIGRRHWQASQSGGSLLAHYTIRTLALVGLAVGVTGYAHNHNALRIDVSSEQLSTLSDDTLDLLRKIRTDKKSKKIQIDAYVSPQVPTEYVSTKLNFLSVLEELRTLGGNQIQVTKHEIENFGPEAVMAETNFGITPQQVLVTNGSERTQEEFFLGAAISSGLDKVVVPFFDKGIPAEYELVRSILTVAQTDRLKLGVIDTGLSFVNPSENRGGEWPLITELRKQYDIGDRPIDPSQPIPDIYDVLLVIQPSMLGPQEMDHLVDAVRNGTPIAILEDPHPHFYPESIPGTAEPKRSSMSMFGGGQPQPKGDIEQLWRTLGVSFDAMEVVSQEYSPDQTVRYMTDPLWVFIDSGNGAQQPFNEENPISSGLNQLLFLYPGSLGKAEDSPLTFEPLAVTGDRTSGTVSAMRLGRGRSNSQLPNRQLTSDSYILAAHIHGTPPDDLLLSDIQVDDQNDAAEKVDDQPASSSDDTTPGVHAVLVADIDWIIPDFFSIRQAGDEQLLPATQNVTFILNIIDTLASEGRFIELRKRTRQHRTLVKIDAATKEHREKAVKDQDKFVKEVEAEIREAEGRVHKKIAEIEELTGISALEKQQRIAMIQFRERGKLVSDIKSIEAKRNRTVKQIQYQLEQQIRTEEDLYKLIAILIPPIPPLLVAFYVFFRRREAELEGISQQRRR